MTFHNKQIYIVDDDESVRRALKFLLITYGFAVKTFSSAENFFSAVPNSAAGCLILDIHLQGMDGWEAQQKLFQTKSQRPVIIITADKSEDFSEQAIKAGAVGFLQKPFDDRALVDLVNVALAGKSGANVERSPNPSKM